MKTSEWIGVLPKAFIILAFCNFIVGAILGGLMVSLPQLWGTIGAIHGEINPYGWLTMMIYGMTYAVLSTSAGLKPPRPAMVWLHACVAEASVVVVVIAYLFHAFHLLQAGLILQALAPVLFLANILSAVYTARRTKSGLQASEQVAKNDATNTFPAELGFLRPAVMHKATDRVAQRGTDVALMIFILATWWTAVAVLFRAGVWTDAAFLQSATLLTYYGWIAGTVLSVALHLYPRFLNAPLVNAKSALIGQVLWGAALVFILIGSVWTSMIFTIGSRILGVAFVWHALCYLSTLHRRRPITDGSAVMPLQSVVAWYVSWGFALALGISLVLGVDPLSLAALHMLFLGWVTTLVYGVGYSLLPIFFGKISPDNRVITAQLTCSVAGAVLMVTSLLWMNIAPAYGSTANQVVLGVGGTLAAGGALIFLLSWPLARNRL